MMDEPDDEPERRLSRRINKLRADRIDQMIENSSLGTPGAKALRARAEREYPGAIKKIVERVRQITGKGINMSIQENALQLKAASDLGALKALSEQIATVAAQIKVMAEDTTSTAAGLLGENHQGVVAITGNALRVVEVCERYMDVTELEAAIDTLSFTMNNVGDHILQVGG